MILLSIMYRCSIKVARFHFGQSISIFPADVVPEKSGCAAKGIQSGDSGNTCGQVDCNRGWTAENRFNVPYPEVEA